MVKNLVDQDLTPGTYNIGWDGRSTYGEHVASGVYYYKIVAGSWTKTKRMVLVK
jgi:flagellar hook assembly protein FlgD